MGHIARTVNDAFDRGERLRLLGFGAIVVLLHAVGWGLVLSQGAADPTFVGLGGLAYAFGLRHAFDADHISAIDNTTRKLLQQGRRPIGVGFFFSLGHSTVVFLIALALGFAAKSIVEGIVGDGGAEGGLKSVGATIGTTVSGVFLILIGILNLIIFLEIVRIFRDMRRGKHDRDSLTHELVAGGFMTKAFGRLFKFVTESWHMYPIGFLFGLGFDTASEVALLAISAGAAAQGLSFYAVISLPITFAAGMSLMDTADGAFMSKAYGWAFSSPIRKVFYNLTMTGLSVFVALFVGVVELSQLLIDKLGLEGQPWDTIAGLDFGSLGFVIVGAFVLTWIASFAIFRLRRVEERWEGMLRSDGAAGT
ncbi:MAG TPA: HoxN/HupN/NixA family nickel/cobalt transporter [Candidatus Limnocylindria bacterium]|nr:HoxN/HupN/NixA family nickel/cobalt transporter [Candidatus Limnocylindria bacterium]